jgi:hypothetical protein
MNMKTVLIAAAIATVCATATAQAHQWYILDASHAQCEDASAFARAAHVPNFATPYRLEMFARVAGIFQDMDISRDENGQPAIVGVKVVINGTPTEMMYFRDVGQCKFGAAMLPSPNELN